MNRIVVIPHDPTWKTDYENEAKRITPALGDVIARLHHIGSTSIPGIHAKPIIDFLLVVDDLDALDGKTSLMEELGYEVKGEFGIPGRRYFRRNNEHGIRTHHIHAFATGSPEIDRHLAFRDYMIAHPIEAQMYSELKQQLALQFPDDIHAYMDGKDPFIKEYQAKAIVWWRIRSAPHQED